MFTREDKKNVSRLFFGIFFYSIIIQIITGILMLGNEYISLPSWLMYGEKPDSGAVMLCAVCIGCLILWAYFSLMQKKHGLFNLKGYVPYSGPGEPEPVKKEFSEEASEGLYRIQRFDTLGEGVFRRGMRITVRILLIGLFYAVCCQIISQLLGSCIEKVFNGFGFTTAIDAEDFNVSVSLPMALYIALIGPFAEELVYRGFLMNGLKPYGKVFAIVVSAVFFALMHGNLSQIPFAFMCGILLGYTASEYSVIASTIVHIINNGGFSFGMIGLQKTLPENGQVIVLLLLVLVSAAAMIMLIVRHREDLTAFITGNKTLKGSSRGLINIWVLLFLIMEAAEIVLSVNPLK